MDILTIASTEQTPSIVLNPIESVYTISGRSLPEDSAEFYRPVIKWLEDFKLSSHASIDFVVKLDYFNTSSSKMILDILQKLKQIKLAGKETKILWYFQEDDEDMQESGQEFAELVDVTFEFISY
jgi:hypothetical protein